MTPQDRKRELIRQAVAYWRGDWNAFIRDCLGARLDTEQQAIVDSCQHNPMTSVASGTARGKDYVAACVALAFLYLTPDFNDKGALIGNTKIALTAPTNRQVHDIMIPEIRRLVRSAKSRYPFACPGRLVSNDIRTDYDEWFLTGFKSDDNTTEVWSGFHAVHTMFVITEASGISETIYNAIEGNLQGDSRVLLVFNPNVVSGYAARSMSSDRFAHFRLNSLHAENVVKKQNVIPGQVDYRWVEDKVKIWCSHIQEADFNEGEGDFEWEGGLYRPNDLFRVKVLGMFPKAASDSLIPYEWVVLAQQRWKETVEKNGEDWIPTEVLNLGVDVAGMGRDSSNLCPRYGSFVTSFIAHQSAGKADHMRVVGMVVNELHKCKVKTARALIDTIGEGAGVYSRLVEMKVKGAVSCKFSESAKGLSDITGQYKFANMRAYLHWCVRDWLNPKNKTGAMLPPDEDFLEEATSIKWLFQSDGSILIEKKDDIKQRLGRSPDKWDSLCNSFYPVKEFNGLTAQQIEEDFF